MAVRKATGGRRAAPGRPAAGESVARSERILDVAEELFALHGFDGVTLRQIAKDAGVDVALASYHFGRKRELFDAVFHRRAETVNKARHEALRAVQAVAGRAGPTVEQIIEAFLRPLEIAQETGDRGWRNYLALVAYVNNSPVWGREMMSQQFNQLVQEFIAALRKALPGSRPEDVYWCYHYLSGALTLTLADTGRIDELSHGKCRSGDFRAAYDRMIPFIAAGFRAVCSA